MRRVAHALAVGLVGAGLVHIAIVMLLPGLAAERSWNGVRNALPLNSMAETGLPVFAPDPFFRTAGCRFDLRNGPVRLRASGAVSDWTVTVYAPDGTSLAGLNERSMGGNPPDLLILTSKQRASADPAAPAKGSAIEVEAGEALAVLQVFVPDSSWSALTDAFLASATCTRMPSNQ